MDWREYFEDAFRLVNRKITSKEKVVVFAPDYLKKLTDVLNEYNSTNEKKMYAIFFCVKYLEYMFCF